MMTVMKKKKYVKAFEIRKGSSEILKLVKEGKIQELEDGSYAVYSAEAINGKQSGEVAHEGDWIKLDTKGLPYPNEKNFFKVNHRHVSGDIYEQISKPLKAWDATCDPNCPEIIFLQKEKGLIIDITSTKERYRAVLWGTLEVSDADTVIVFYSIEYGENGIIDADFNFVNRETFNATYDIIGSQ